MRIREIAGKWAVIGSWGAAVWVVATIGGCAGASENTGRLQISPGQYEAAFDAALAVSRENHFAPDLRDRRRGILVTEPVIAPSILEPWDGDGSNLETRTENTFALRRRVVRFEFLPIDEGIVAEGESEAQGGPDLLGLGDRVDLSRDPGGDLELRVWVFLERAQRPGIRRSTWSRKLSSQARIIESGDSEQAVPPQSWSIVGRDLAFEERLLAAVGEKLAATEPGSSAPSD